MIVSYKTGAEFLQDNQTYLQKNPYLSTFFTLDAPLLQEAGKSITRCAANRAKRVCWL